MSGFRCSLASVERAEVLAGTASTVRAFLLVEAPGPWGVDAVTDSRLPDTVMHRLEDRARLSRVRVLMIRRHGRSNPGQLTVFAAHAGSREAWVETTCLRDPRELLDLDLAALGSGRSLGLAPHDAPLFLVCTHGKHDACCAERGRPVARALSRTHPQESWEVSHLGGDRFAANMLVLPEGLYYGRLTPQSATTVAAQHQAGQLDLDHLRGRCGYPFAVQAAETFLRREAGLTAVTDLALTAVDRAEDATTAAFTDGVRSWEVGVATTSAAAEQLTCRAQRLNPSAVFTLIAITAV